MAVRTDYQDGPENYNKLFILSEIVSTVYSAFTLTEEFLPPYNVARCLMAGAKKTADCRMFLGEAAAAAAGLAALTSLAANAETTNESETQTPSRDVIDKIVVIKDDHFSIPGGGEDRSAEWEITGQNGVLRRFRSHGTRIERGDTYTVTTDVTILTYPAGANREAKAPFSGSSLFGVGKLLQPMDLSGRVETGHHPTRDTK